MTASASSVPASADGISSDDEAELEQAHADDSHSSYLLAAAAAASAGEITYRSLSVIVGRQRPAHSAPRAWHQTAPAATCAHAAGSEDGPTMDCSEQSSAQQPWHQAASAASTWPHFHSSPQSMVAGWSVDDAHAMTWPQPPPGLMDYSQPPHDQMAWSQWPPGDWSGSRHTWWRPRSVQAAFPPPGTNFQQCFFPGGQPPHGTWMDCARQRPRGTFYAGAVMAPGFFPLPVYMPFECQGLARDWTQRMPRPPDPAPLLVDLERQGGKGKGRGKSKGKVHPTLPKERVSSDAMR